MKHKGPTDPRTWLLRARAHLTLAEKGGRLKGIAYEDLCFNAQQAAKKALKVVCLGNELDFPKTHPLVLLMDVLESGRVKIPSNVREADVLTQYAVQSRYPSFDEDITKGKYRDTLNLPRRLSSGQK